MKNNDFLKRKWQKFLGYRPLFGYIPFVDFVLVAGSFAGGNVHKDSDFDVIVGVKSGRIFTARFFCVILFGFLGIRRKGIDHKSAASDKVCFNHFVTLKSYRLQPPYNTYWRELYRKLVPVFGKEETVRNFFEANSWSGRNGVHFEEKYWQSEKFNVFKKSLELVLWGPFGDAFELVVKKIQIARIRKSTREGALGFKPRLRYSDEELEFHPDTSRIEKMIQEER